MSKTQAEIFADDRPTSCDQTLYQWAVDAEELIRKQAAWLTRLLANLENSERIASTRKETIDSYKRAMDALPDTQTRYFPIMKMPAGSVIMTSALVSLQACQNDVYNGRHGSEKFAGALEVEFIPETLELVSAKIIKIENFPTL